MLHKNKVIFSLLFILSLFCNYKVAFSMEVESPEPTLKRKRDTNKSLVQSEPPLKQARKEEVLPDLSEEIWLDLFSYIPDKERIGLSLVCKGWFFINNKWPSLRIKDASLSEVTFLDIINRFTSVRSLEFNRTSIPGVSEHLSLMANLEKLIIGCDQITDASISSLVNLTYLEVNTPYVYNITNSSVSQFKKLKCLKLSSSSIDDTALRELTNLQVLRASEVVTNESISVLTNLQELVLYDNKNVTDDSVKLLTNLTTLDISGNFILTDDSVSQLTKLEQLSLVWYKHRHAQTSPQITDTGLIQLKNLTYLDLTRNKIITHISLRELTNLIGLRLFLNNGITDESLSCLVNLQDLDLGFFSDEESNSMITDKSIGQLTNLRTLGMSGNPPITDESVSALTNLTALTLNAVDGVTDRSLRKLTNLRKLTLGASTAATDESISLLTNLTSLRLVAKDGGMGMEAITDKSVSTLPKLSSLELSRVATVSLLRSNRLQPTSFPQ